MNSLVAIAAVIFSTFVEDKTTMDCLRLCQEIRSDELI